jgi:hypothetical protein
MLTASMMLTYCCKIVEFYLVTQSLFKYYKRKDTPFAQKVGSYKIRVPGAENPAPWEEVELIIKHLSSQQQL